MTAMCRVCTAVQNEPDLVPFSSAVGGTTVAMALPEVIAAIGGVPVGNNDGLPQHCCIYCLKQLKAALRVRQLCQESDRKLREMFAVEVKDEPVFKEEIEETRLQEVEEPPGIEGVEIKKENESDEEEEFVVMQVVSDNEEEDEDETTDEFRCGGCKRTYDTYMQLVQHAREVDANLSEKELQIEQCRVYVSTVQYSMNKKRGLTHHHDQKLLDDFWDVQKRRKFHDSDVVKCAMCPDTVVKSWKLPQHVKFHMNSNGTFNCLVCRQYFIPQSEFNSHNSDSSPHCSSSSLFTITVKGS